MEEAREQVADLIGASAREIVFTSGATESNNLSIKGVARFYKAKKKHIITTQTVRASCEMLHVIDSGIINKLACNLQEHKCVLDSCRHLELEVIMAKSIVLK